jgi:hypothetical protein
MKKKAGGLWRIVRYGKFFKVEKRLIPLVWLTVKKSLTTAGVTRDFPILFPRSEEAAFWIGKTDPQGKINFPRKA